MRRFDQTFNHSVDLVELLFYGNPLISTAHKRREISPTPNRIPCQSIVVSMSPLAILDPVIMDSIDHFLSVRLQLRDPARESAVEARFGEGVADDDDRQGVPARRVARLVVLRRNRRPLLPRFQNGPLPRLRERVRFDHDDWKSSSNDRSLFLVCHFDFLSVLDYFPLHRVYFNNQQNQDHFMRIPYFSAIARFEVTGSKLYNTIMIKIVSVNKKAYHDYEILDKYEAGIVLLGTEIKAIRQGRVNLKGSYGKILGGPNPELFLVGAHIGVQEGDPKGDPIRTRKLLMHRQEINSLIGKLEQKKLTLVPLKIYLKNNQAKIELGLAKGKKLYDKREAIKKRDLERELGRKTT